MISKITKIEKFEKKKDNKFKTKLLHILVEGNVRKSSPQQPPWRAVAQGLCLTPHHATPEARHGVMRGFCNTIFNLSYLFNVLFC